MKIDPQMVAHFKGIDYAKVLFIHRNQRKIYYDEPSSPHI